MNTGFFLTIPSNTPGQGNRTNHFKVTLPKQIELDGGGWQVGLCEVTYRNTILNLRKMKRKGELFHDTTLLVDYRDRKGDIHKIPVQIPPGHYKHVHLLCQVINCYITIAINVEVMKLNPATFEEMNRQIAIASENELQEVYLDESLWKKVFTVDKYREVVCIDMVDEIVCVQMSKALAYMLGFDEHTCVSKQSAKVPPDLRSGVDILYVECSIINYEVVGNTFAQLLRTVPVRGDFGDSISIEYPTPHYVKLLNRNFNEVEFHINDYTSSPVPFAYGNFLVKLHFKNESGVYTKFA